MRTLLRLAAVALCADLALYLIMTALPFRILALGGGPKALGLIPAMYAAPYALLVLFGGRLSDRVGRRPMIRTGALLAAAGAVVLSQPLGIRATLACIPILSLGLSLLWPSVQAGFSELKTRRGLSNQVGLYNLSWSSGKGLGFLCGGLLLVSHGGRFVCLAAGASYLAAAIFVPELPPPANLDAAAEGELELPDDALRVAFRRAAWIANGLTFGIGATFNHHLPPILAGLGMGEHIFGWTLGLIFLVQTLSFVILARARSWHYRLNGLLVAQLATAALALSVPRLHGQWALLALAPLLGLGLGFAYQSSLYYSLHAPHGRGKFAGVHEASLGFASAALPLLGGLLASASGNTQAPFMAAAAAVAISAFYTGWSIRRARRRIAGRVNA